ncbi:hypothetical protein HDU88_006365 [Geranomyces variabilis]|nr:hypothetical protein HDU88_006365 [Geranomyces variabilis]
MFAQHPLLFPAILADVARLSKDYEVTLNLARTSSSVYHAIGSRTLLRLALQHYVLSSQFRSLHPIPDSRMLEACICLASDFPETLSKFMLEQAFERAVWHRNLPVARWVYQHDPDVVLKLVRLQHPPEMVGGGESVERLESRCYLVRFAIMDWLDGVKWLVEELGFDPCDPRYLKADADLDEEVERNWYELYGHLGCDGGGYEFHPNDTWRVKSPLQGAFLMKSYECAVWLSNWCADHCKLLDQEHSDSEGGSQSGNKDADTESESGGEDDYESEVEENDSDGNESLEGKPADGLKWNRKAKIIDGIIWCGRAGTPSQLLELIPARYCEESQSVTEWAQSTLKLFDWFLPHCNINRANWAPRLVLVALAGCSIAVMKYVTGFFDGPVLLGCELDIVSSVHEVDSSRFWRTHEGGQHTFNPEMHGLAQDVLIYLVGKIHEDEPKLQKQLLDGARVAIELGLDEFLEYLWPRVSDALAADPLPTVEALMRRGNNDRDESLLEDRDFAILERVAGIIDLRPHAARLFDIRNKTFDPAGRQGHADAEAKARAVVLTSNPYVIKQAGDWHANEDPLLWMLEALTGDDADMALRLSSAKRAIDRGFVKDFKHLSPHVGHVLAADPEGTLKLLKVDDRYSEIKVAMLDAVAAVPIDLGPVADSILEKVISNTWYRGNGSSRLAILEWVHTHLGYDLACRDGWLIVACLGEFGIFPESVEYLVANGVEINRAVSTDMLWRIRDNVFLENVKWLRENAEADLRIHGKELLIRACDGHDQKLVLYLGEQLGFDLYRVDDDAPVKAALAAEGYGTSKDRVVEVLHSHGVPFDIDDMSELEEWDEDSYLKQHKIGAGCTCVADYEARSLNL